MIEGIGDTVHTTKLHSRAAGHAHLRSYSMLQDDIVALIDENYTWVSAGDRLLMRRPATKNHVLRPSLRQVEVREGQ